MKYLLNLFKLTCNSAEFYKKTKQNKAKTNSKTNVSFPNTTQLILLDLMALIILKMYAQAKCFINFTFSEVNA